jgi:plastocyanin
MSKARGFAAFSALTGLALLASACVGGGGGGGGNTINAKKGGFAFEPSTTTVEVNKAVQLTLNNPDTQIHDWKVRNSGLPQEPTLLADPGKKDTQTFTFPNAGTFVTYCSQPGHEASGMVGQLIVK